MARYDDILGLIGNTPLVGVHQLSPNPERPDLRQARGPEPGRVVEGPHRAQDDRAGRARRRAATGRDDPRAVVGQHRHRARAGREAPRLQAARGDARERLDRAAPAARDLRCGGHAVARRGGEQRRDPHGGEDRTPTTRSLRVPVPVRQPRQPARALRGNRSRRSGATAPRSTCSSPGSAPAARSWASAGT